VPGAKLQAATRSDWSPFACLSRSVEALHAEVALARIVLVLEHMFQTFTQSKDSQMAVKVMWVENQAK
jgi:hypothetical protein